MSDFISPPPTSEVLYNAEVLRHTERRESLKLRQDDLRDEHIKLSKEMERILAEDTQLKATPEDLVKNREQISQLREQRGELQKQMDKIDEEFESNENQIRETKSSLRSLRGDVPFLRDEASTLAKLKEAASQELDRITKERDAIVDPSTGEGRELHRELTRQWVEKNDQYTDLQIELWDTNALLNEASQKKTTELDLNSESDLGLDLPQLTEDSLKLEQLLDQAKVSFNRIDPTIDQRLEHRRDGLQNYVASIEKDMADREGIMKQLTDRREKLTRNFFSKLLNRKAVADIDGDLKQYRNGQDGLAQELAKTNREIRGAQQELEGRRKAMGGLDFSREEHLGADLDNLSKLAAKTDDAIDTLQKIKDALSQDPQLVQLRQQKSEVEKQWSEAGTRHQELDEMWMEHFDQAGFINSRAEHGDKNALQAIDSRIENEINPAWRKVDAELKALDEQRTNLRMEIFKREKEIETALKRGQAVPPPEMGLEQQNRVEQSHHESVRGALSHDGQQQQNGVHHSTTVAPTVHQHQTVGETTHIPHLHPHGQGSNGQTQGKEAGKKEMTRDQNSPGVQDLDDGALRVPKPKVHR